jgi:hypothetical protein
MQDTVSQPQPYTTNSLNRIVYNLILPNGDFHFPLTFKNGIVKARLVAFGDGRPPFQPFELGGSALFFRGPCCDACKLRKAFIFETSPQQYCP